MATISEQKMIPPQFLADHYCVILKSGVRVYVKADGMVLDDKCQGALPHHPLLFIRDNVTVAQFAPMDITAVIYPEPKKMSFQQKQERLEELRRIVVENSISKTCRNCKQEKKIANFSLNTHLPDGFNSRCRSCEAERVRRCFESSIEIVARNNSDRVVTQGKDIAAMLGSGVLNMGAGQIYHTHDSDLIISDGMAQQAVPPHLVIQIDLTPKPDHVAEGK